MFKNDCLFCNRNTVLNNYMISPDFDGKLFILSERTAQNIFHSGTDIWNKIFYINKHPILHLSDKDVSLFRQYYQLLLVKMKNPRNNYHKEIILSIVQAVLYEMCSVLSIYVNSTENIPMKQGDLLFKKYMDMLSQVGKHKRSVKYYADRLCVTSKYLSIVCKDISGQTASNWIHESTMDNIRFLLKNTDKSIKEISEDLEFPTLSFFGKYVKQRTGYSPKELRKKL